MRARTLSMTLGVVLALAGCTLAGCTKEAAGLGAPVGSNASALISGRVFDSEKNEPVKNATVTTSSGKTATTDDDGNFTVEADPGKTVLTVEESGHAKGVKEVEAYKDAESYVEVFSKPVDKDSSLNASTGGMVKVGEMTVLVPADSLETEDGTKYNGQVTVEVATVRPEKARDLSAFPGKFDGTTVDDMAGSVATRAAASIRLLNAAGQPLRMSGAARVEIFMPFRSAISQRTRLWKLQEQSADWAEVPFAAVRDVDPITHLPALRSAVAALTWWNAGEPFSKSRIRGCLGVPGGDSGSNTRDASVDGTGGMAGGVDAGVPRQQAPLIGDNRLAGIQVVATGIGYGYFAERYTDDNGCFDIEVKANGPVAVYAQTRRLRSVPQSFMAPDTGMVDDIGMLPLGDRDGDCPGVMQDCNGQCVDLLSDDANCGECNAVCAAELPVDPAGTLVPIHCVYGVCGCDDNNQDSSCAVGACANVETDPNNCGGCGNTCPSDHDCAVGECVLAGCVTDEDCSAGGTCDTVTGTCGGGEVIVGMPCGTLTCPGAFGAESDALGFLGCCGTDDAGVVSCGVASGAVAPLANACASTEFSTFVPGCNDGSLMLGDTPFDGVGCCRSDNQCGLVLTNYEDLGCILASDLSPDVPSVRCSGTGGADAGATAGTGGGAAGGTAGAAGGVGGSGGMSGADAGVPLMDAGP